MAPRSKSKPARPTAEPRKDGKAPRRAPSYQIELALAKFREPVADPAAPGGVRYRNKSEVVHAFVAETGKTERHAWYVASEAERWIEAELPIHAAQAAVQRTKLAKRYERLADKAENTGKFTAATMAAREVGKLYGLYAPKKIHVQTDVNVTVQLSAIIDVLDDADIEALERIDRKIEQAKASGLLALPAPPVLPAGAETDGDVDNN